MAYTVLLIGCGAIAGGYDADRAADDWPLTHAGAIARSDDFELVACVDPDEGARTAFAKRWGVPVAAASVQELGAEPGDYDCIVIASPTGQHALQLRWALNMTPRTVFCEKPLADTARKARKLALDYDAAGVPLAVNFTRRWAPDLRAIRDAIASGRWGALINAVGTYSKGVVHNGSHMIDLIQMLVGPVRVSSTGPALCDHWKDDPSVSAILTAGRGGQPVHLVAGDARRVTQFELVLNFANAEIAMRDGGMRIETRRVQDNLQMKGYRQLGPIESAPGRYPEAMSGAYDNLAAVIAGTADPASNGIAAADTQAICEKIRDAGLETIRKQNA